MLSRIEIDGYRSLIKFSLDIQPGLNIFIGPNGSGKTNIISFFQFISRITKIPLSNAVSQMGGVGAFFTKEGERTYRKKVDVKLYGRTDIRIQKNSKNPPVEADKNCSYLFSFSVAASEDFTSIFFSEQHCQIVLEETDEQQELLDYRRTDIKWDFDVLCSYDEQGNKNISTTSINPKIFGRMLSALGGEKENVDVLTSIIKSSFSADHFFVNESNYIIPILSHIAGDLSGGDVFNIVPSRVRENEDISTPYGVKSDGSGLSATLYHINRSAVRHQSNQIGIFSRNNLNNRRIDSGALKRIVSLLKLVNSSIDNLSVESDPLENTIKIRIIVNGSSHKTDLPLNLMSDGTLKWLALTTALETSGSIFAVEEPENYLHPLMQKEILEFIRKKNLFRRRRSFVVMSTHSETLLNAAKPTECIIVSMQDGATIVRRPETPIELEGLISETGFGLGHMYISGSLNYA